MFFQEFSTKLKISIKKTTKRIFYVLLVFDCNPKPPLSIFKKKMQNHLNVFSKFFQLFYGKIPLPNSYKITNIKTKMFPPTKSTLRYLSLYIFTFQTKVTHGGHSSNRHYLTKFQLILEFLQNYARYYKSFYFAP